jgi:hypothetical protein
MAADGGRPNLAISDTCPPPRHPLLGITVAPPMMARAAPGPLATCPGKELTLAQISQIGVPAENIVLSQAAAQSGYTRAGAEWG